MSNKSKQNQSTPNRKAGKGKQTNNNNRGGKSNLPPVGALATAPVAQTRTVRTPKPKMTSLPNGNCRISHREYIQDVVGGTGNPSIFKVDGLQINPGNSNTFPWLSQVAQRFEKYRFKKLLFLYETDSPSSLGGTVIMTIDYDSADQVPLSKQQMLEYKNAVRSAPWNPSCHRSALEDLRQQNQYFVNSGSTFPANQDARLYNTGNFWFGSQNVTGSSQTLGELYVEYEVELLTPSFDVVAAQSLITQSIAPVNGANPMGTTISSVGPITATVAGTSLLLSGLIIGARYQVLALSSGTTFTDAGAWGAGINSTLYYSAREFAAAFAMSVCTCSFTATSGTLTWSPTAASISATNVTVVQVPQGSAITP